MKKIKFKSYNTGTQSVYIPPKGSDMDVASGAIQGASIGANPELASATSGLSILAGAAIGAALGYSKKQDADRIHKNSREKQNYLDQYANNFILDPNNQLPMAEEGMMSTNQEMIEVEKDELIFRKMPDGKLKLIADFKGGETHEKGGHKFIAKKGDIIFPGTMRDKVLKTVNLKTNKVKNRDLFEEYRSQLPTDEEVNQMKYGIRQFPEGEEELTTRSFNPNEDYIRSTTYPQPPFDGRPYAEVYNPINPFLPPPPDPPLNLPQVKLRYSNNYNPTVIKMGPPDPQGNYAEYLDPPPMSLNLSGTKTVPQRKTRTVRELDETNEQPTFEIPKFNNLASSANVLNNFIRANEPIEEFQQAKINRPDLKLPEEIYNAQLDDIDETESIARNNISQFAGSANQILGRQQGIRNQSLRAKEKVFGARADVATQLSNQEAAYQFKANMINEQQRLAADDIMARRRAARRDFGDKVAKEISQRGDLKRQENLLKSRDQKMMDMDKLKLQILSSPDYEIDYEAFAKLQDPNLSPEEKSKLQIVKYRNQ